jgi:Amt family ammonium transporter
LAFSEGNGFIGGFDYFMLNGITPQDGEGIPQLLDVMFQGTFAAIAVAIVSGSIIERVKFSTWTIFSFLWVIVVYAPICHWVWGSEGFLTWRFRFCWWYCNSRECRGSRFGAFFSIR